MPSKLEEAFSFLKEGYFEDAAAAFSEYLFSNPDSAAAFQGRGMARSQLRQWLAAVSDFGRARELDPDDPENSLGLAGSLAASGKIYEAIDVYEALLADQPECTRGHIQLARLYYQLGVIAKGHGRLDAALRSRPSPAERQQIEALKKEQLTLDKKRYHRPDFEALRRQNHASGSLWTRLKRIFKK
ncbi:MAG: tetratricopeptide repeat protein [Candidatus Omnitrophica bacterium]|nr:tetratricopeptide repeat protein [Candidatus Omnitrophota bacterium]